MFTAITILLAMVNGTLTPVMSAVVDQQFPTEQACKEASPSIARAYMEQVLPKVPADKVASLHGVGVVCKPIDQPGATETPAVPTPKAKGEQI